MTDTTLGEAYQRIEAAFEAADPPRDNTLDDFFLRLRHLPPGAPIPEGAILPPPPADAPPLDPALMAQLLTIPGPRPSVIERLKSWLLRPGPALAFALALIVLIPLLSSPEGTIKGPASPHPNLGHALALHIVTQSPEGHITHRSPEAQGDGIFTTPIGGSEPFQLVLSSPSAALDTSPRYAFVAAIAPGEAPQILLPGDEILTPSPLPGTRSLYTLPRPLTLGPTPGPRRLLLILSTSPLDAKLQESLLTRRSSGNALPVLTAEEAQSLGAVEGSIPLEVR